MRGYFARIHKLIDDMEEANATTRGDVNAIYEEASEKLDAPKSVLKLLFGKDRRDVKDQKKARKMDGRERAAMESLAKQFGADSEIGKWAAQMAALGGDGAGVGEGEGEGADE